MGSQVVIGVFIYCLLIAGLWFGASLSGALGSVIFWVFFILSSFIAIRLIGFIREYFIFMFAKCHEIDQGYIDEEMRKYEESIKER